MVSLRHRRRTAATGAALLAAAALTSLTVGAAPAQAATICEQYGSTTIGGRYVVQNNRWGTSATQCIETTSTGFRVTQSGANVPTNGAPASYPSIYFGCHYGNCSPGTNLPMAATDPRHATLRTSVSMTYPSSGTYDAAYDIWYDPTPRTTGQNTGAEIMVWLNRQGSIQPIGSPVGNATINGESYQVWFGNVGWSVISYVHSGVTGSLNFPVAAFFNDSLSRGYTQRSWYLTSVQAGFEPWIGGAGLAVTNFSVTADGSAPSSSSSSSTRPATSSSSSSSSSAPAGSSSCTASFRSTNTWNGGYQGEITVKAGSAPTRGWTVSWTPPGGSVSQAWNATVTTSGGTATARDAGWNGTLSAGASTSFGFIASGTPGAGSLRCSAS
ncbi:MAG: cellulose binding domain-containing protein [Kineosporiaceae bacterium]